MHWLFWILGMVGFPLSHYWLIAGVEPFYSSIYCCLWWPYIFLADFLVFKLRGNSMLRDRRREFAVLWLWSVPAWGVFELVNLRIQNWYYVMAPADFFVGLIYLVFAFGAVLPGVFVTVELILGLIEKFAPAGKISGPPFAVTPWHIGIQLALGVAMLVLVFVYPKSCFAMAWGFAFFLIDPICYWLNRKEPNHVGRSLLGQLAAGDNSRFVAFLFAGLLCGGLWEGWNLGARTKWIYTVPFFDELKLGEMPVLGFLGFPPFALECYAMVHLLSYFRGGRNWEFDAEQNRKLPGMPRWAIALCTVLMSLGILIGGIAMLPTISSFAEPLEWHFQEELGAKGITALRKLGASQANEFLKLKERPSEIDEPLWNRMRRVSRMAELKGIGLSHALQLEHVKITTFEELARETPEELQSKLNQLEFVRTEIVKVWILGARKMTLRRTPDRLQPLASGGGTIN
jgi:hypothetical protein